MSLCQTEAANHFNQSFIYLCQRRHSQCGTEDLKQHVNSIDPLQNLNLNTGLWRSAAQETVNKKQLFPVGWRQTAVYWIVTLRAVCVSDTWSSLGCDHRPALSSWKSEDQYMKSVLEWILPLSFHPTFTTRKCPGRGAAVEIHLIYSIRADLIFPVTFCVSVRLWLCSLLRSGPAEKGSPKKARRRDQTLLLNGERR